MSRRWVTREDFAAEAGMATDPARLIRKFLPKLRGHIHHKYAWMDSRGNCVISVDDLVQIASITLMSLADRWADIIAERDDLQWEPDSTYDGLFFSYLKNETKFAVLSAYNRERRTENVSLTFEMNGEEHERPSLYDYTDGEMHDRTGVRRRPDGPWFTAVYDEIMSFWYTQTPRQKMALALRFYDELPYNQVGELIDGSDDYATQIRNRWRAHARNQLRLGDDYEEIPRLRSHAWEPSELLTSYLRDRHNMDIHEYLGIVTISFRTDPDYLVRILDSRPATSVGVHNRITDEQIATIDRMAAEGYNFAEIGRAVGITKSSVAKRLSSEKRARYAATALRQR